MINWGSAYDFILRLLISIVSFLPITKAKQFIKLREENLTQWMKADLPKHPIWFHVSSVGELEQVRPVVEILRKRGKKIVLTYFSNSVPRLVKDWSFVDFAGYLPLDTRENQLALTQKISPSILVLNRYDLWPGLLFAQEKSDVKILLLNASIPPQGIFGFLSVFLRKFLFNQINSWAFVDSSAAQAWEPVLAKKVIGRVTGNTRVDRAITRAESVSLPTNVFEKIKNWSNGKEHTLLVGSSWPDDEDLVLKAFSQLSLKHSKLKIIIVPHEPYPEAIQLTLQKCKNLNLEASLLSANLSGKVCIVDGRGFLSELYGLSFSAFVGGGFARQIHSIIEPLSHYCTVAIGPHFSRSPEAITMSAIGAVCVLKKKRHSDELAEWWEKNYQDLGFMHKQKDNIRIFLQVHRGAGERVVDFLAELERFDRV